MPNRLKDETSPYLLQHVNNPVDWYPWGQEALELAKINDKPILLSIGYAACHWCHVMAHESFEHEETATYMNQHFVNIKVDREERPDLDSIYMSAVQAMTGQGGWPMTVVLTPRGEPFFGGTYFPLHPRHGMPSFRQVLASIVNAWLNRREEIDESVSGMVQHLKRTISLQGQVGALNPMLLEQAVHAAKGDYDASRGGFGGAPKFPPSMTIEFLLRKYVGDGDATALAMAERTLLKMAQGGIYDQIGGGFARYATDANWLVPHFEKMLYDNAQLARVYLHAWQITKNPLYRRIVEETLDFVTTELTHEQGGFLSSLDADSEGEEGKFYVWSASEIHQLLGDNASHFMAVYGISDRGNWEGKNIPNVVRTPEHVAAEAGIAPKEFHSMLAKMKQILYQKRAQRIWPGLDDKVLTAWNGLMLAAFAEAGRDLDRADYTATAVRNAEFLYQHMRTPEGRLLRTWKAGHQAKYNAYLEDYGYLGDGLLALYQNTFDQRWLDWAGELAGVMVHFFADEENGGFFDTSNDHESLFQRPKDIQDNAVPSGNAMAANLLLRLSLYTGDTSYWDTAEKMVASLGEALVKYPTAFSQWLSAAWLILSEPNEIAIIGTRGEKDTNALLQTAFTSYRPNAVVAVGPEGSSIPLLTGRSRVDGRAAAYVCRRFVCQTPVTETDALAAALR